METNTAEQSAANVGERSFVPAYSAAY